MGLVSCARKIASFAISSFAQSAARNSGAPETNNCAMVDFPSTFDGSQSAQSSTTVNECKDFQPVDDAATALVSLEDVFQKQLYIISYVPGACFWSLSRRLRNFFKSDDFETSRKLSHLRQGRCSPAFA